MTWSVGGGGTIPSDGMFTAGDVASNTFFTVKASSIDNPSVTGTARFLVITLRAGRYTSIENTAEVGFFLDAGACGDPANFRSFGKQPRSWTLDVTSLPTAPEPYIVTFTNVDPGTPPIQIDFLGNVVGDQLKKITLATFEGGVNLTYFKVASELPGAPLVAIEPTGLCPEDSLFYPARGWKVFFKE